LVGEDRLQDDPNHQHSRGREVKREEHLRLIQKTQVDTPVGELDRGL
jgi:hypothetical protein